MIEMFVFCPLASPEFRNSAVFEDSGGLGLGEIVGKDAIPADDGAFASPSVSVPRQSVSCRNK